MKKIILAVLLLQTFESCTNNSENKLNHNTQKLTEMDTQKKAAIEKTLKTYFGSLNASDVNTAVGSYTNDGVFMPAKFPTATGTAQLFTAYENVFKAIQLNVTLKIEEVIIRDDIAFASTLSNGTTLIHATGEKIPEENREFFLLRNEGGEWKIARYMFNQSK
jgi:ketosteroid isomerase-like protein